VEIVQDQSTSIELYRGAREPEPAHEPASRDLPPGERNAAEIVNNLRVEYDPSAGRPV